MRERRSTTGDRAGNGVSFQTLVFLKGGCSVNWMPASAKNGIVAFGTTKESLFGSRRNGAPVKRPPQINAVPASMSASLENVILTSSSARYSSKCRFHLGIRFFGATPFLRSEER